MTGWYSRYLLPRIVHAVCRAKPLTIQRRKVVPLARGLVLEVGIGSGLNFPYYDRERVTGVIGLDPSANMTRMAKEVAGSLPFTVEFIEPQGEEIPLQEESVDTVLITYTLCTIPEPEKSLREMMRVLKPGGELIFCEHGMAPETSVRRWQDRLNPLWSRLGGGCNLNRDIPLLIREGGFQLAEPQSGYIPGWRPASFNYWGVARKS